MCDVHYHSYLFPAIVLIYSNIRCLSSVINAIIFRINVIDRIYDCLTRRLGFVRSSSG